MKFNKKFTLGAAVSAVLLAASFQAGAVVLVSVGDGSGTGSGMNASKVKVISSPKSSSYDSSTGTASGGDEVIFTGINSNGWADPTMSYKGWTHNSKWIFVDVPAANKTVKISVASTTAGFHPAVSVWLRTNGKTKATEVIKATSAAAAYLPDHAYEPKDYAIKSSTAFDGTTNPNGTPKGDTIMNMQHIVSAYDADNLGEWIRTPAIVDTAGVLSLGTTMNVYGPYIPSPYLGTLGKATPQMGDGAGKLDITFTAPKKGLYQIALGGVLPDKDSALMTTGGKCHESGDMMSAVVSSATNEAACLAANSAYRWFADTSSATATVYVY